MGHYLDKKALIYAYCLLPNHFHLLVRVVTDDFIQSGLQPFFGAYVKAVNHDQNRVGPLFQGRFQAKLINDDAQLLDCVRYIHRNPVEAGLVRSPVEWNYSSYQSFLLPTKSTFVDTSYVMQFFDTISEFIEFSGG
jgi:REP element-mobilizing transposase RayT